MAEERGLGFNEDFDIDKETRFSSVFRGISDNGYEENEIVLDSYNTETFGVSAGSLVSRSFSDVARVKNNNGTHASSSFSSLNSQLILQSQILLQAAKEISKTLPSYHKHDMKS